MKLLAVLIASNSGLNLIMGEISSRSILHRIQRLSGNQEKTESSHHCETGIRGIEYWFKSTIMFPFVTTF